MIYISTSMGMYYSPTMSSVNSLNWSLMLAAGQSRTRPVYICHMSPCLSTVPCKDIMQMFYMSNRVISLPGETNWYERQLPSRYMETDLLSRWYRRSPSICNHHTDVSHDWMETVQCADSLYCMLFVLILMCDLYVPIIFMLFLSSHIEV